MSSIRRNIPRPILTDTSEHSLGAYMKRHTEYDFIFAKDEYCKEIWRKSHEELLSEKSKYEAETVKI